MQHNVQYRAIMFDNLLQPLSHVLLLSLIYNVISGLLEGRGKVGKGGGGWT